MHVQFLQFQHIDSISIVSPHLYIEVSGVKRVLTSVSNVRETVLVGFCAS
jgi:hypothetical protein